MNTYFVQAVEYLLSLGNYFISDGQKVIVGGVTVVGVVIALMGVIKNIKPIKNIKNSTARKVILAWLSVFLTVGITVISISLNELKKDHFWALCIINSIGTVLIYWLYENTALRNLFEKIGKAVLGKVLSRKPSTVEEAKELTSEIHEEVESLLNTVNSESLPQYKDDDLKNL